MKTLDRRTIIAAGSGLLLPGAAVVHQDPPETTTMLETRRNLFTRAATAVRINGQGPFLFVIDTGAGVTSVSRRLVDQLALPEQPPILVHGVTSAAVTPSVLVDRLTVDRLRADNLVCPVVPDGVLATDGLLGLDVLDQFKVTFDVERGAVQLDRNVYRSFTRGRDTRIPEAGPRIARGRFGQMILTQVIVGGVQAHAFIDSGGQYSIGNRRLLARMRRPPGRPDNRRVVQVVGVSDHRLEAETAWADDIRLNNARMGPTPLHFADLHCFQVLGLDQVPALLIGSDLLSRFRTVILDFVQGNVTFAGLRRQEFPPTLL